MSERTKFVRGRLWNVGEWCAGGGRGEGKGKGGTGGRLEIGCRGMYLRNGQTQAQNEVPGLAVNILTASPGLSGGAGPLSVVKVTIYCRSPSRA